VFGGHGRSASASSSRDSDSRRSPSIRQAHRKRRPGGAQGTSNAFLDKPGRGALGWREASAQDLKVHVHDGDPALSFLDHPVELGEGDLGPRRPAAVRRSATCTSCSKEIANVRFRRGPNKGPRRADQGAGGETSSKAAQGLTLSEAGERLRQGPIRATNGVLDQRTTIRAGAGRESAR